MTRVSRRSSEQVRASRRDVFIAYAQGDRNIARQLAETLRRRGLLTWMDTEDIQPGSISSEALRDAVEDSRLCIVLVSDRTSLPTHSLSAEWAAIQESVWRRPDLSVCPVVLDNADIPVFLRGWRGIRLSRKEADIESAVDSIVEMLGQKQTERAPSVSEHEISERATRFSEIVDTLTAARKTASNE